MLSGGVQTYTGRSLVDSGCQQTKGSLCLPQARGAVGVTTVGDSSYLGGSSSAEGAGSNDGRVTPLFYNLVLKGPPAKRLVLWGQCQNRFAQCQCPVSSSSAVDQPCLDPQSTCCQNWVVRRRSSAVPHTLLVLDSSCGHNWCLCFRQMEQSWRMWWTVL